MCRYSFGVESSFILLQPMYSFALHDISPETPHTNWECPKTERDHIRVAFKTNGRGYLIRDTVIYPPAHDIVKPLVEGPDNVHEWWNVSNLVKAGDEEVGMSKQEDDGEGVLKLDKNSVDEKSELLEDSSQENGYSSEGKKDK